ncbi:MAG: AIM24 family protein [Bacteroidetes bacterium]|nr:AIM24 family protein [Bacteroidota bacterium]
MQTNTGGGIFKGLKRIDHRGKFFITGFTNNGNSKRKMAFAAPYPRKSLRLIQRFWWQAFLTVRKMVLCTAQGIEINIASQNVLVRDCLAEKDLSFQELSGDGNTFLFMPGNHLKKDNYCLEKRFVSILAA